jgi:hypothetical protein
MQKLGWLEVGSAQAFRSHFLCCAVLCCAVLQSLCSEAIAVLRLISKHWWDQMLFLTMTESNAEVLAAGAVSGRYAAGLD